MSELFLKIINMSISASWIVLAVLIFRLVLKKAPKWVNVLLWGIVAVRLVCPFSIESALSLIPSAETIPMNIAMERSPAIDSGIRGLNDAINPMLSASFAPQPSASANPLQIWIPLTSILWIVGMGAMLLYAGISYWRLRRRVDTAVRYKENIFQSENIAAPFVLGIFRPRIYLPFALKGQELEYVIAHERAHIRRGDALWKPLGFLLLMLHWFNPLVWLAYILLCRDIELACDEKVIRELGNEQRADYSQALVSCSTSRRRIAACPLAFGEVGVKDRVKSVMNYRKPAVWSIVLAGIACIGIAVCFLTNPAVSVDADLAVFLDCQIASHHQSSQSAENFCCLDWEVIGKEQNGNQTTVYMWVLYEEFSNADGLKVETGSHILTAITAEYREGSYHLVEYWEPKDGSYYKDSIQEKVPMHLWSKAMDSQRYIGEQSAALEKLAMEHFGIAADTAAGNVIEWFDYFTAPSEMPWGGRLEIDLPEFPKVTFRWYPEKMEAVTGQEITPLYYGAPIWNAYFCDLTGDGLPEICSTYSFGSEIVDTRIIIYDYANGASYALSDRGYFDFALRYSEKDDCLYVDKAKYQTDEIVESGRLVFSENCIRVEGFSAEPHAVFHAKILEIGEEYFLVKPLEGSWELSSADRIRVPMKNMQPSPEPGVGDVIEIEYGGGIMETYPAQLGEVYHIKVVQTYSDEFLQN